MMEKPCSNKTRNSNLLDYVSEGHDLYLACKEYFKYRPDSKQLSCAQSQEEADFYISMADFFLQQKQKELIDQGIF